MNGLDHSILTLVTFAPAAGALLLLFAPRRDREIRVFALLVSLFTFVLSLHLPAHFHRDQAGFQFDQNIPWIPTPNIHYHMGMDGISLWLVLLTTFLTPLCVLISWKSIHERVKEFFILLLVLETALIGVFVALDLFLFYFFWEATLIPMALLIGMYGHGRRVYAAIKFFLYTLAGSVLMLLSILALYFYNDGGIPFLNIKGLGNPMTFSVLQYHNIGHLIPPTLQVWIFAGFFFGFAIKVPMFPFHTWLPDVHVEAPTAGSVILAAVLLKMGTYGFVRFALPILPDATQRWLPWIVALSIIGIVYGALVSLVQKDMKKLVAYSSVSHLGFVMLGMFALNPMGIKGSVLQMINHGISTGALFLLVGILYERRHTRLISEYGGLAKQMPTYATLFLIAALSSMGLPALNGFIGEFTILLGAANRSMVWAAFAALGIVLGAAYLLWLYQRVFWGPLDNPANKNLLDVNRRELITLLPLVVLMVWIGIAPKVFFDIIEEPVNYVVRKVDPQYFNRQPVSYPTVPVADHNEVAQAR